MYRCLTNASTSRLRRWTRNKLLACVAVVSRESVLEFSVSFAANTRVGGFVRAARCLGKVQTQIAFSVSLLVVWFSPIIYRLRSVLSGSKLPKSAVRGASFKFARAALFGFWRYRGSGFRLTRRGTCGLRPQRRSPRFARVRSTLGEL